MGDVTKNSGADDQHSSALVNSMSTNLPGQNSAFPENGITTLFVAQNKRFHEHFINISGTQDFLTNDPSLSEELCLFVSSRTWTRDSHDLFDYEASDIEKKSYFIKTSFRIFRNIHDVQILPDGHSLPSQSCDYLLSVRQHGGRFIISPAEKNLQGISTIMSKRVWIIVKELSQGYYQLQESDIIKLGRYKLRVRQLVKSGPSTLELQLNDVETPHSTITPEEVVTMQCRICLLEGGTAEDPLVCPCQCKGSIKFVHVFCLRQWINGRLSLRGDTQSKSFFLKQLQCELCKTPFPSAVILNGERVPVVSIPKIEAPYIILENICGLNRGFHVVSMEERKELRLGRGHESDMRIADVSISRYHATIRFTEGEFILEDHNSKFGTLVALRKVLPVEITHPLSVQVGRTVLTFSLQRPPVSFNGFELVSDVILPLVPEKQHDVTTLLEQNNSLAHTTSLPGGILGQSASRMFQPLQETMQSQLTFVSSLKNFNQVNTLNSQVSSLPR